MPLAFPAGSDVLPPGRQTATIDEIEAALVDAFPASTTRRRLFEHWRNLIAAIERVVPMQSHWVNGSFVSTKVDPGDVDIVTVFDGPTYDALDDVDRTLLKGLLSNKLSQALHDCDSYFLIEYPAGHPFRPVYEASHAYWDGWFSRDRGGNPKGYVELARS